MRKMILALFVFYVGSALSSTDRRGHPVAFGDRGHEGTTVVARVARAAQRTLGKGADCLFGKPKTFAFDLAINTVFEYLFPANYDKWFYALRAFEWLGSAYGDSRFVDYRLGRERRIRRCYKSENPPFFDLLTSDPDVADAHPVHIDRRRFAWSACTHATTDLLCDAISNAVAKKINIGAHPRFREHPFLACALRCAGRLMLSNAVKNFAVLPTMNFCARVHRRGLREALLSLYRRGNNDGAPPARRGYSFTRPRATSLPS